MMAEPGRQSVRNHAPAPPVTFGNERDRLGQLDLLLRQIEEAVQLVRTLLPDVAGSAADPFAEQTRRIAPGAQNKDRPDESAPDRHADVSPLSFIGGSVGQGVNRELLARRLIRDRFGSIGHVGAGVLMRLLSAPGQFVSREDLAESAGVRSRSNRVIKVYICRLRSALAEAGLPASAIETGRLAYRLKASAAPKIIASIEAPPG